MGNFLSGLLAHLSFGGAAPARVCMIGLDGAGKTTILHKLKFNEVITTIPTIGFNVDEVTVKNLTMTVWDVGGQTKIRPLWQYYFESNDALVFVVDSADRDRLSEARNELHAVLRDDRLRSACLLVLANKQDLSSAAEAEAVSTRLGLHDLLGPGEDGRGRPWLVQGSCAHTGGGLLEGFSWLAETIRSQRKLRRSTRRKSARIRSLSGP